MHASVIEDALRATGELLAADSQTASPAFPQMIAEVCAYVARYCR